MDTYRDSLVECADDEIRIHGYYFPWGTKRIAYSDVRVVRRVALSALRGRGRIWGTANPNYWANLDPHRPRKRTGLILDLGRHVKPFITPDDPDAAAAAILAHTDIGQILDGDQRGPII